MSTTHLSYCRNCAANCGMKVEVEDNRILSVAPEREHAISAGYLCIKGHMNADLHNGQENRLTQCLQRNGDGSFEPAAKEAMLDTLAERLRGILDRHGPRALGLFFGTGSYMDPIARPTAKSFVSAMGSPNVFSTMTIDQSSKWVTMQRMGIFASGRPALEDTDVVLLAGNNTIVSHEAYPFTPVPNSNQAAHIRAAKARGTRFIVIDPRRTETARFADLFIQPLPGHDAAIFACLINLMIERGYEDQSFCNRYVSHLDELRAAVRDFTPALVAARARIPEEQLVAAAEMYGRARRPSAGCGTGVCMSDFSNLAEHLCETLNALRGGYLRAGDVVPNPGIFVPKLPREMVIPPMRCWESGPRSRNGQYGQIYGEFPTSILPSEILESGPDQIRALIVFGGNPVMALGDPERTLAALKSLELLVVLDPRMTETAKLAHYVVPPPLPFEKSDLTAFNDMVFFKPFAQYTPAILSAPEGVMEESYFFWGLAKRLGVQLTFKNAIFGMDYSAIPGGIKLDEQTPPSREGLLAWLCQQTPVSLDELKTHPRGFEPKLPTMILEPPAAEDTARLDLCPADVAGEISDCLAVAAQSAKSYRLSSRRLVESFNGMFRLNERNLGRKVPNYLYVNPEDMSREDLGEGDAVEIIGDRGQIVGYVRSDSTMRPGVVSMAHCWGALDPAADPFGRLGGHTSRLVSLDDDLQTINRMPRQSGIPVDLRKMPGLPEWADQ
ncbi:MAG: hypothetical protein JWQ90_2444 [Hydrocarboniphaga sp.]|uniref:molybdopterin-containing oxidoreductase family protein n=1 Tax=Hydrocarboniphaga sp. TaxID=2033016 RepID=UPI002605AAC0|nr:molybdopterin-dependent oxidoreductase [Hydrocarboniphaga sp.]MDB5969994.1 hypothetical protein [Hydrocarboniphaga sp.]